MGEPEYDLFISYAAPDRAWVEGYLRDALDRAGVRVLTEGAFALGHPRLAEFERAVTKSRRVVLVLSPAYLSDETAGFVDLLAQTYGLDTATWPVIPLLLEPVALPPRLAMLTALDATDPADRETAIARLTETLRLPPPPPAPLPACPYPGMRPFIAAEAPLFHGREAETEELVQRFHAQRTAAQRFLTVIGPSGSGKSSLIFAGLVPALCESTLFGPQPWQVLSLRPGPNPMTSATTVIQDGTVATGPTIRELADTPPLTPRLLVVDQFEELFTLTFPDQRAPFEAALTQLAGMPDTYVVLTARADFYPELMASALWPLIQVHRVEVLPLDEAGLRQAILRPAERVGVYVEAALVERLVADAAGEPGVLPLVQQTLVLLWEKLERRFLPLRAYEALVLPRRVYGEAAVGRTGLEVAVARHADAVLAGLTPAQQAIARRIFLRLIQFGEGRADTRRQRGVDELRTGNDDPALVAATLEHLAGHRLLTLSGGEAGGARRVDLAHEALIAGWPWLGALIAQRREAEQARQRLEDKAREWERLGRGRGGLLDDAELAEAERWLARRDAAELGVSAALPVLVVASRTELVREQRQLRRRLYGAVAFALVALVAAGLAFLQFQAAEENAEQARAAQARA
jgi:energy-coupling factor transporter ATP-binding protein EcfA2